MFYINNDLETKTRFDMIKFLNFDVDNIDCLGSYMLLNIPNLPMQGTYTIMSEEKRPDLLSYSIYEDTQYWWILMWYNSITSIEELKSGITLGYPSINAIQDLYTRASKYQKTIGQ